MADLGQFTSLKQTLTLAPQMQQSLKILQANTLELREIAAAQLNSNPLLEEYKSEADTVSLDAEDSYSPPASASNDGRDKFFNSIPERESFQEHLRNQANLDIADKNVLDTFHFLADFLDERGYLPEDAVDEAIEEGFLKNDINAAIEFMQNCEPAGVGARDIWECFMIQLRRKGRENSTAYAILESHIPLLEKRKIPELSKLLMVSPADVEHAIEEISELDPAPAKTFSDDGAKTIEADLVFKKTNGAWTVKLTNEYVPQLRINNTYREMLGRADLSKLDGAYIREKVREGKFIIDAIESRQITIFKIGEAILAKQQDFFEKGAEFMRPLTMAEVAEIIGVDPSTVSRAVSGKYARIGYHLMPLKDFFTGGYAKNDGEGALASSSVKKEIREIIENENPSKPLSDARIAEILKEKNLDVARRTVAKYREEMGIPVKTLRKRFG